MHSLQRQKPGVLRALGFVCVAERVGLTLTRAIFRGQFGVL